MHCNDITIIILKIKNKLDNQLAATNITDMYGRKINNEFYNKATNNVNQHKTNLDTLVGNQANEKNKNVRPFSILKSNKNKSQDMKKSNKNVTR